MTPITDVQADEIHNTAHMMFTNEYGAIPPGIWQAILAAIASIIGGCPAPTPAGLKTQWARPLFRVRMFGRLWQRGVPNPVKVIESLDAALAKANDDQLGTFISAMQDAA